MWQRSKAADCWCNLAAIQFDLHPESLWHLSSLNHRQCTIFFYPCNSFSPTPNHSNLNFIRRPFNKSIIFLLPINPSAATLFMPKENANLLSDTKFWRPFLWSKFPWSPSWVPIRIYMLVTSYIYHPHCTLPNFSPALPEHLTLLHHTLPTNITGITLRQVLTLKPFQVTKAMQITGLKWYFVPFS